MTSESESALSPIHAAGAGDALPLRYVMYFPLAESPADENLTIGAVLEAVEKILCQRFGGVTSYPAKGLFKLASVEPQSESVQVLEAYGETRTSQSPAAFVFALAETVAGILGQESLACSVGGRMHLMQPHPAGPPRLPADEDFADALAPSVDARSASSVPKTPIS